VSKPSRSVPISLLERIQRYKEETHQEGTSDAAIIRRALEEFLDREAERYAEEKARAWQRAQKD
jgi:hypothetical protein